MGLLGLHNVCFFSRYSFSPALKMQEERTLHEAKLAKMEAEMNLVFQQKVSEKESKLKQSEEELYARHREMKDALERQLKELEAKKSRIESGRPPTPDNKVRYSHYASSAPILTIDIPSSRRSGTGSVWEHKELIWARGVSVSNFCAYSFFLSFRFFLPSSMHPWYSMRPPLCLTACKRQSSTPCLLFSPSIPYLRTL